MIKVNDTIQDIHLLDENFPDKSLDILSTTFTPLKGHKRQFGKLINEYVKIHKMKKEPIGKARTRLWKKAFFSIPERIRIQYGCGDADATGCLRRIFKKRLKQDELIPLHNLMRETTRMFVDIECNGIRVDTTQAANLAHVYKNKIDRLEDKLNDISEVEMNHNSPLQVARLIYGKWKLPAFEVRVGKKRVKYTTAKEALDRILQEDIKDNHREYLTNFQQYKKFGKLHSTYLKGLPRYLRNGYIHPTWNLSGTDTGRSSCSNPNLQQIPRDGEIKSIFTSRYGKDGVLLQCDVKQGEPRISAHISRDPLLISIFRNDEVDPYKAMAAELLRIHVNEVTDEQRYRAKQTTLAIFYGSGAKTAASEMGVSVKVAQDAIYNWKKTFKGWLKHVHATEEFVIHNHYVRNLFGRYRHLFIIDPLSDEGRTLLRKAVNAPIQGSLADYNRLCGTRVWNRLKRKFQVERMPLFVGEVHDSWMIDTPKYLVKSIALVLKEEFESCDTLTEFGFKFKVPMKIDIKVGPNWKEMEEYEI